MTHHPHNDNGVVRCATCSEPWPHKAEPKPEPKTEPKTEPVSKPAAKRK